MGKKKKQSEKFSENLKFEKLIQIIREIWKSMQLLGEKSEKSEKNMNGES